ncbi:MAG: alpha/beta hydrolase [Wenzhouxiangellaceae bacterium]|nr:MAG: alpha/beta hydrolase [Wenzhouxiangellaceae bacterium]
MKLQQTFAGLAATIAIAAIASALTLLWRSHDGLVIERGWLDSTPVTIYRPGPESSSEQARSGLEDTDQELPVVLISHGFAGSQQLMQAFAVTLARHGFLAVSFDYYGHGRNLEPLTGDVMDIEGATRSLVEQTAAVADFALALPEAGPGLAVLGHSMASDIIVRHALSDPRVQATVAVSMFSPAVTADAPRNLLVIVGNLEGPLKAEALRVVRLINEQAVAGETVGSFSDGSARRAVFAPGVEHVGVLYSPTALRETVAWLDQVFARNSSGPEAYIDRRGLAIPLLLSGLVLLAWPLSKLLPRVVDPGRGLNPGWRELWPAALLPAVATPLLLFAFPADFLGVLVGGYLAVHFAVYGLLTAGFCFWLQRRRGAVARASGRRRPIAALLAASAATLYAAGAIGLVFDQFITSFAVTIPRLPLLLLMLGGTMAYFMADEWLTRGPDVPRAAHLLTRFCFLLSLGLAVALSFEDLFFLLIIAAVIVPYFLLYGLLSGWVYRATGDPLVSALPSAVAFGWTLAVVFPQLLVPA